jgi:hypothetical protein
MVTLSQLGRYARVRALPRAFALALSTASIASAGEVLIERTLLQDATPSSFAIGFSSGVNFCYDVTRGGLSYAWQGGFVDITTVRPNAGKNIAPVPLLGEIVYRETGYFPLRRGDAQKGMELIFKGYRLKDDAIEFLYEIDRCRISEEIRPLADGKGIVRRFRIEPKGEAAAWWYVPGETSGAELTAPNATRDAGGFRFDGTNEFSLEVHFEKATS